MIAAAHQDANNLATEMSETQDNTAHLMMIVPGEQSHSLMQPVDIGAAGIFDHSSMTSFLANSSVTGGGRIPGKISKLK